MEINVKEILAKHGVFESDLRSYGIQAIKEIITEVLKEAADSAELKDKEIPYEGVRAGGSYFIKIINKKSITSTINKVKF